MVVNVHTYIRISQDAVDIGRIYCKIIHVFVWHMIYSMFVSHYYQCAFMDVFLLLEEDVPMSTDAANLMLSSITGPYGNRKDPKQFLGNPISDNFKRNTPSQQPGIGHGIITIDNISASNESTGLGNSAPSSPSHNVQKAPVSHLLPHRVLILPTSPTVVSPPGSATLPNQPTTYSINGKVPSMNSCKTSTVDGHSVQFVPVSSGKGGMQLQPIILPSTPPASNGTTGQNFLNFIPISPKLVQSSPLLQPITSMNPGMASPRLTTSPENGMDMMQNISYLKGLDHKAILKLLRLMDLDKYHPMFIQVCVYVLPGVCLYTYNYCYKR